MRIRLSALAFALLAFNVSAEDNLSSSYLEAMERDLGISESELPQYINAEERASDFEQLAIAQLGDQYAGSWMERLANGQYEFTIATSGKGNAVRIGGANIIEVNYSLSQLEAAMEMLNETADKMNQAPVLLRDYQNGRLDGLHSWHVDVKSNRVVLAVAAEAMDDAVKFIADSGVDIDAVRIEESEGTPSTLLDVWGGQAWSGCSVGFTATRGSTKGFATAGHCGPAGTRVTISGTNVGSLQFSNYPGDDMAWATVRSGDTLWPYVTRYNGGSVLDVRVRGSSTAAIGASVCRSGRTTGYRCGVIVSRNASVNYGQGTVSGLTRSTACAGRGDSGGSWITPAGQAQGVTSGGQLPAGQNTNCSVSTPVTWFQPINEIISRYGLRLVL
ncbi:MAG: hypothetical protein Tsb002_02890 [Wenzhouxiangellaceae bacterium]